jgi:DNA-binding LacI/PurR family transcriptional regulator
MAKKRVTQADVAQAAGVSQTAVSQILGESENGVSNFRPETRLRVLQAAEALGYSPSIMARALRTNRTMTIGVVISFITDELSVRIARGILDVTNERGYGILMGSSEQNPQSEARVLDQLRQYQVDGLIFVDSWTDPDSFLDDPSFPPMVFAQLRKLEVSRNCVSADDVRGGYEVTRHLLDLGRRKVAYISGPEHWSSAVGRLKGHQQALQEYGIPWDPSLVEIGDWEVCSGIETTKKLLDRHPDIDAIFAANDLMAAGCIQVATERGLRIPQDLALVGYDDRQLAQALCPPLTSFAHPLHMIGQKAAHLLIDRLLKHNVHHAPSIRIPGRLVIRDSCGAKSR